MADQSNLMLRPAALAVISSLALASCTSSGVAQTGADTYTITTTAITSFGGAGAAKGDAFKAANAKCAETGKHAIITNSATSGTIASGSADVTFKCQ